MNEYIELKNFDFSNIKGLSIRQLSEHYKLYKGYVNKINEIWNIENENKNCESYNTIYSECRSLKKGESYALNGTKLHEMYFENITGSNTVPKGNILKLIIRDFISYDNFKSRFEKVALSMRGWVVLGYNLSDNKLHIFGSDEHDTGSIWMVRPILVMDVYEHAYMIDYGIDRKKYIDVFFNNIDFDVLNERLENCFYNKKNDGLRNVFWGKYCK